MAVTILIVANDKAATASYASLFSKKEYAVRAAHSGRHAIREAKAHPPDAIVLDATSSRLNCKTIGRRLKSATSAPLLLITLPNAKVDSGINPAGVVPKPAVAKRLVARVKSAIESKPPRVLTIGKLALDLEKHKLTRGGKSFGLTPKEFALLKMLMERAGQVVSRKVLMKEVWQTDYLGDTRTLDVHIRWVRKKVEEDPSTPRRLLTARGEGYRFVKEEA